MNNTNNQSARQAFTRAKEIFFNAWIGSFSGDSKACEEYVEGLKLSQHEVRLEVNLVTTATQFKFGLTPNQQNTTGVNFVTENRLQMQDSLVCSEYGIYVAQTAGNNDSAFPLRTYPNTVDFAAADAAALRTTFYSNGYLRISCNNDVIVPYRGLFNHLYKPQTQQTAALGPASPDDQVRGAEDGMVTMEPNLLFVGSKGYEISVNLPVALASAAANIRCILILRGVLAQNSTPVS